MIQRTQFLDPHTKKEKSKGAILTGSKRPPRVWGGAAQHLGAWAELGADTWHRDSKPQFSDPRRNIV